MCDQDQDMCYHMILWSQTRATSNNTKTLSAQFPGSGGNMKMLAATIIVSDLQCKNIRFFLTTVYIFLEHLKCIPQREFLMLDLV